MASTAVVPSSQGTGTEDGTARRRRSASSASSSENTRKESLGGAVARSLLGSLAFFFRLPIRLFRPVKLSSWTVLESFAKRERKTLSLSYLIGLIRRERNSFLFHLLGPPIVFNTLVGFTLFESYSLCEAHLLKKHRRRQEVNEGQATQDSWTPLWIVTVAGSVAGAAQCILSAPLDNVRLVLASHRPVGRRNGGRSKQHAKPSLISWRSVMKAAILPFAPLESQHRRLVKSVQQQQQQQQTTRSLFTLNWSKGEPLMSKQQRKVLQQTLRNWSGGVHGSGLLMSLARDSVGFGSFFFIFEVSRRCAHGTSLFVDRSIAWWNAGAALPSVSTKETSHTLDVDFSYNASRTKTGRVVAAFVLLVGGAIGAFAYEWVGRPFELMRVVIWHGRRAWEREKARAARVVRGGRSERHVMRGATDAGTVIHLGPASMRRRRRVQELKERDGRAVGGKSTPHTDATPRRRSFDTANHYSSSSRLESLVTLRAANSAGTRLSRLRSLLDANHPPHPLRSLGRRESTRKTSKTAQGSLSTPHRTPQPRAPSALSLLLTHAEKTSTLAYTSSSRKFRTAVPAPVLLLHTYFLAPYNSGAVSDPAQTATSAAAASQTGQLHANQQQAASVTTRSASRLLAKWTHRNPVSRTIPLQQMGGGTGTTAAAPTFLPPRPASAPQSPLSRFGQGRVAWALRRLASPYGIGFVAFAWMSGDV